MKLLAPIRFRFTDPVDVERYGDRWYVYDESLIARLPVRQLVELEQEMGGLPILGMMREFRTETAMSTLAAFWLALRLAVDRAVPMPDSFDEFSPLIMFVEWESVEPVTPPLDLRSSDGPSTPEETVSIAS